MSPESAKPMGGIMPSTPSAAAESGMSTEIWSARGDSAPTGSRSVAAMSRMPAMPRRDAPRREITGSEGTAQS